MIQMTTNRTGATAIRLLRQLGACLGPGAEPGQCHEREWASATFAGARHSFAFRLPLADRAAPLPDCLAALPDHEFDLPGDIVADCSVAIHARTSDDDGRHWLPVVIEVLTVTAD